MTISHNLNQPTDDSIYYLYALAQPKAGHACQLPGTGLLPETPVVALHHRGLLAVVSPLPHEQFNQPQLELNLQDTAWLQRHALAHQQVLVSLLADYTVLPLKFCTLYHSEARIHELLATHYNAFEQTLARLSGATEWGLNLFCDRQTLQAWVETQADELHLQREAITRASTGAAYFLGKKLSRAAAAVADTLIARRAEESHRWLSQCARAAVSNTLQPPQVHGRQQQMALNSAYLVDDTAWPQFRAAVAALEAESAAQGFHYEISGPWPPYCSSQLELTS